MASLLINETLQLFHENCAITLSEAFWCAPGLENYVCALRYFARRKLLFYGLKA